MQKDYAFVLIITLILDRPLILFKSGNSSESSENEEDYLVIEQSVVEYAVNILNQMGDDESDVTNMCEIMTLLGQVPDFRQEFVSKGGLQTLFETYRRHKEDIPFAVFGTPLLRLLPSK